MQSCPIRAAFAGAKKILAVRGLDCMYLRHPADDARAHLSRVGGDGTDCTFVCP